MHENATKKNKRKKSMAKKERKRDLSCTIRMS